MYLDLVAQILDVLRSKSEDLDLMSKPFLAHICCRPFGSARGKRPNKIPLPGFCFGRATQRHRFGLAFLVKYYKFGYNYLGGGLL